MKTVEELDRMMCRPSKRLVEDMRRIEGDILVLGAGGKMGPTLCKLCVNAIREAGMSKEVYAVSRFHDKEILSDLQQHGIRIIHADLLKDDELESLPSKENVIFMAGRKFGTSEDGSLTWVMNAYLPGRVGLKFRDSRLMVFSSGNVYPMVPITSGGATEDTPVDPVGAYAQSCVGREQVFRHFANRFNTRVLLFRLNYAIDLRYGILLEIARAVRNGNPIDLSTGNVNVIWQGSANEYAIRSLLHCDNPPRVLNITGPETVSIRWLALEFAKRFGVRPVFTGIEQPQCLLSNASQAMELFGYPEVTLEQMIHMTWEWVRDQGSTYDKSTHFQEREGKF